MGAFRRILTKKWARWGMLLTVLFLALFVLPLHRYRPTCGGVDLPGPMRDDFIGYMERNFIYERFFHIRFDDEIFMRMFNPLYYFNPMPLFNSYDDLLLNSEDKYADAFIGPYARESTWNRQPEAKAARDDGLAWLRDHADDDPAMHPNAVILSKDGPVNCTKFYALAIRTETMPPERRLRFLPEKSPQSPVKR